MEAAGALVRLAAGCLPASALSGATAPMINCLADDCSPPCSLQGAVDNSMKGGLKDKLFAFGQQAAAAAAHGAKAAAKLASQEVLGASCLMEYSVGPQVASSGPLWKVYSARSKKEGEPSLLSLAALFDACWQGTLLIALLIALLSPCAL